MHCCLWLLDIHVNDFKKKELGICFVRFKNFVSQRCHRCWSLYLAASKPQIRILLRNIKTRTYLLLKSLQDLLFLIIDIMVIMTHLLFNLVLCRSAYLTGFRNQNILYNCAFELKGFKTQSDWENSNNVWRDSKFLDI